MSWAEIKKAVNSDLSTPLNEKMDKVFGNGAGHGFKTASEPSAAGDYNGFIRTYTSGVNGGNSFYHVVYYKEKFHFFYNSNHYAGDDIFNTTLIETISLFSVVSTSLVFAFNDYIYATNGNSMYRYDGSTWTKVCSTPDSYSHSKTAWYIYGGYVWFYQYSSSYIYRYDGNSNWESITIKAGPDSSNAKNPDTISTLMFFEKDGELFFTGYNSSYSKRTLNRIDVNNLVTYRDGSVNFNTISQYYKIIGYFRGKLWAIYDNENIYYLKDNGYWQAVPVSSSYIQKYGYFFKVGDNYYLGSDTSINVISSNFYKSFSFYLPKNTKIIFKTDNITESDIIPINNCKVEKNGEVSVLEDGEVEFRIQGHIDDNMLFVC